MSDKQMLAGAALGVGLGVVGGMALLGNKTSRDPLTRTAPLIDQGATGFPMAWGRDLYTMNWVNKALAEGNAVTVLYKLWLPAGQTLTGARVLHKASGPHTSMPNLVDRPKIDIIAVSPSNPGEAVFLGSMQDHVTSLQGYESWHPIAVAIKHNIDPAKNDYFLGVSSEKGPHYVSGGAFALPRVFVS